VTSILKLADLIEHVAARGDTTQLEALRAYRAEYGIRT
jgi:hypothetical protein